MVSRGRGLWRQEWYSICSAHRDGGPDDPCELCQCGSWVNVHVQRIDHFMHDYFYDWWFWWHNRRNSKWRRQMRQWFPNLK